MPKPRFNTWKTHTLSKLPDDATVCVAEYLNFKELTQLSVVNKAVYKLLNKPVIAKPLWQAHYAHYFQGSYFRSTYPIRCNYKQAIRMHYSHRLSVIRRKHLHFDGQAASLGLARNSSSPRTVGYDFFSNCEQISNGINSLCQSLSSLGHSALSHLSPISSSLLSDSGFFAANETNNTETDNSPRQMQR